MSPVQRSALNVVIGAMPFGAEGKMGARVTNVKDVEAILDVFLAHGHTEVDTSRFYAGGTSEELLGQIDWRAKGLKYQTKLPCIHVRPDDKLSGYLKGLEEISHTYDDMKKWITVSMKNLNVDVLDLWYLHIPDRTVPYDVTMKAVNELFKEGLFKRFGLSNFQAWEVAEIVGICKANGYVLPTVYQGIYNAIHRAVEPELLPCLKKYGISFFAFNPLGGGFFTGRYASKDAGVEPGARFDDSTVPGKFHRERYWNDYYFKALEDIKAAAAPHNLTLTEVALRWLNHHSMLKRENGDAIVIGASSLNHINENLDDLDKGPLPDDVVAAVDAAAEPVKALASARKYWQ